MRGGRGVRVDSALNLPELLLVGNPVVKGPGVGGALTRLMGAWPGASGASVDMPVVAESSKERAPLEGPAKRRPAAEVAAVEETDGTGPRPEGLPVLPC